MPLLLASRRIVGGCTNGRRAPDGVSNLHAEAFSSRMRDKAKTGSHDLSDPEAISETTVAIDLSNVQEERTRVTGTPRRGAANGDSHQDESGGGKVPRCRNGRGANGDPEALARLGPKIIDAGSQAATDLRRQHYVGVGVCVVGAVLAAMLQFSFVYGEAARFVDRGLLLLLVRSRGESRW